MLHLVLFILSLFNVALCFVEISDRLMFLLLDPFASRNDYFTFSSSFGE
jgi:hypothetical protein